MADRSDLTADASDLAADPSDLIAAPATAPGAGALSVIRLSGPSALAAAAKMFVGPDLAARPRALVLGRVIDPRDGRFIDQALAVYFPGPASFTGEDSVEIQGHGGSAVPRLTLEAARAAGARLARPGEFTQRAFLNGRLSLDQAEAVAELVAAQSEAEAALAARHLQGALSARLAPFRGRLLAALADLTAILDFEEDWTAADARRLAETLTALSAELRPLIELRRRGRIFRDGLRLTLAGPPNAGKSSLFNALLGRDRALVSPQPGTTRDYLEAAVNWSGLRVELVDTAGLRADGADELETRGQALTRRELEQADAALWLQDLTADDRPEPPDVPGLVPVWSKLDLCRGEPPPGLAVSALTGEGLEELRAAVLATVGANPDQVPEAAPNLRQQKALEDCLAGLAAAAAALGEGRPPEIVGLELTGALSSLDLVTGRTMTEDLLAEVFSRFCLGK
ncbi:MAG: tRNA uridine-5-carboxymethylaminomethyl(34) synthesis GTPase MnmE [Deltaproteobacteria bacterium]|jgi:tRNA modification GTPase|nr:tRNA uridine-5-carboxymethylaminomethyl(34) synthesis GTPase MnmE [Deltaproteobacteria bacterium]